MRWEDERYVRLYTRDTTSWVLGPWEARAVLGPVMRRLDRAGTIDLGADGLEGLAALVAMPLEVVTAGMAWWLKRGTFELVDGRLVMPNFLDAQEAPASDAKRAREKRERDRDFARSGVTKRDEGITNREQPVTQRDDSSRDVTDRHESSRSVTPYCAVPSVPSVPPVERERSQTRAAPRGSRVPSSDTLPTEIAVWALSHGIGAPELQHAEWPRFLDYWRGQPGSRGSKADWAATWRNWKRRAEDFTGGAGPPRRPTPAVQMPGPDGPAWKVGR